MKGVEYIIHLAGAVGVGQSFWQAKKYADVNASGASFMYEILTTERAIRTDIRKVIVTSSKSIYGEGSYACEEHGVIYSLPRPVDQLKRGEWEVRCPKCKRLVKPVDITEDKPAQNLSPYALSKYYTERLAMDYSTALGIPTVAFRYFNAYGPRQSLSNPYTWVLAIFLSKIKNRRQPVVFEDGDQLRDFIYVNDIAKINAMAIEREEDVYNVGSGRAYSLLTVLQYMGKALKVDAKPRITREYRPSDNRRDLADILLLKRDFEDMDLLKLEDEIRRLVDWASTSEAIYAFDMEEMEKSYLHTRT